MSEEVSFPDRDTLWNIMFYSLASRSPAAGQFGSGGFVGGGPAQFYYHGANLSMTFANGTSWTHPNRAWVFASFNGVTDGESLYQKNFANKQLESQTGGSNSAAAAASSSSEPDVPVTGYPPAVVHAPRYMVSGYYLDGDYSDIAVLSVPSFSPTGPGASSIPFQSAATKFITEAKQAGKKKLIIDLQANLGGTVPLPTDLYKILFPAKSDRGPADQLRAFDDAEFLFQKYSAGAAGIPVVYNSTNATLQDLVDNIVTPPFNYRTGVDINGKPFTSWEAKYGPVSANNDTFTNRFRWDINSPLVPFYSNGIYVHGGYGPFSNYNSTPFLPEDIIIVTDGMCGSSCSVFVELMRRGADVKVISLGGRPRPGLTQPLGTMKGSVVMSSAEVQGFVQYALANLTSAEEAARLNKTQLGEYWDDTHVVRSAGAGGLEINMFNTIRNEDEALVPLQFVYEPADCRILYTKNMTIDITAVWKAVADSAWGGRDQCIAGSVVNTGSASLRKRELSDAERAHSNKMAEWRASLKPSDYELDAETEAAMLNSVKFWNGL